VRKNNKGRRGGRGKGRINLGDEDKGKVGGPKLREELRGA